MEWRLQNRLFKNNSYNKKKRRRTKNSIFGISTFVVLRVVAILAHIRLRRAMEQPADLARMLMAILIYNKPQVVLQNRPSLLFLGR